MNRAERIYRLHGLLRGSRALSLQKITEELEVSRATVKRDFQYMRDFMEAPIVYSRERRGYHYELDGQEFELPGLWFNASELYALLATEQMLEAVQPGLLGPHLGPLKSRIRRLLEESGHDAQSVSSVVRLQPFALRSVDDETFGRVSMALFNSRQLRIDYRGRERDTSTRRVVHPLRLLHYRDNWYLAGWCERAADLRTFSLDRIEHVASLDEPARKVAERALNRSLGGAFGIFTGPASAWAILRFNARRARWVADENWHPDQIGRFDGDTYELQVPYSDPRELMMDILKYGPDVEVIGPRSLRDQVATRLTEAAGRYRPD